MCLQLLDPLARDRVEDGEEVGNVSLGDAHGEFGVVEHWWELGLGLGLGLGFGVRLGLGVGVGSGMGLGLGMGVEVEGMIE